MAVRSQQNLRKRRDGACRIRSIEGAACPRGKAYVEQELTDPTRNIATSISVEGGELPLTSVRLTAPIPKARIFDAMEEIRRCRVTAPVKAGTVVIEGLFRIRFRCDRDEDGGETEIKSCIQTAGPVVKTGSAVCI